MAVSRIAHYLCGIAEFLVCFSSAALETRRMELDQTLPRVGK